MLRKLKLSNIGERCRICLTNYGCMSDLFDELLQLKLKDLIRCTSIDVKREKDLPDFICHVCLYKLDMWTEFKDQFVKSNEYLLSHLEVSEGSNDVISKRKRSEVNQSGGDSFSDSNDKKKSKSDVPPLIPLEFASVDCVMDQTTLKEMYISEDDPASSKDSSQKTGDNSNSIKYKKESDNKNGECIQVKPSLVPMKVKSLAGRRGRKIERRRASTKRWVERKKALLATSRKNVSDTDSVASDDTQLSPVQKARAKTNADKEAERQKRLTKALENLETNMVGKYGSKHDSDNITFADTDSDVRRSKLQKVSNTDNLQNDKDLMLRQNSNHDDIKKSKLLQNLTEKENSPVLTTDNITNIQRKNKTQAMQETFIPHSVKSELQVGDATYIVTSTLILAEPHYLNKAQSNNLSKDSKNLIVDEGSQEKNTDIIDAVQLRRIHPTSPELNDKKSVEKCLNIEVEGTELEALKRVQVELAGFVEKEMKQRLLGINTDCLKTEKIENVHKSCYQTLDQQLKNIVEKAIKKNVEISTMKGSTNPASKSHSERSTTVSPSFVKAADNQTNKIITPIGVTTHKRQSVPPIKFNDYNTSIVESDSNVSEDDVTVVRKNTNVRNTGKYGPASKKQLHTSVTEDVGSVTSDAYKSTDTNTVSTNLSKNSTVTNEQKVGIITKTTTTAEEKLVCSECGQSFINLKDIEMHVKSHKIENTPTRHNKHKMMRCKRCHEIVEARFVKVHVCRSMKQIHKCYVCNSTFRTEKLLVRHLESHDQSEFTIENVAKVDSIKASAAISTSQNVLKSGVLTKRDKDRTEKTDTTIISKMQDDQTEILQPEKITGVKIGKIDNVKAVQKQKETYTCFVCDKIFTDEEVLKDHLQKHCDDMSEDEHSTGKEQYQCAICGDSLESEDALEAHVEKHLFDDEDDNPNLISIANETEKPNKVLHNCLQCTEVFASEMLLEMHMQAHEEEAAIAEWEKQGMKTYEFQCMICDELFETEEELSEHLDIHNGNAHVCQLCEKPFISLEDLQKHVATH